ncbi:hypothetical protein Tco_0704846 [Tanacetum coccineum]|uniref:Uncharacterized protein n=1 Tax=Tanacetum coccineum TaxID=301880 RepID=A0ABQ4Y3S8_9ASTR
MSCTILCHVVSSYRSTRRKTRSALWPRRRGALHFSSPPRSNHPPHLHDDDDDDDNGNNEGTSRASTPSPTCFVNSLTNEVPRVFSNPPNIDPDMEPFYTRNSKLLNRQVNCEMSVVVEYCQSRRKGNSGPEKLVMSLHKFPAVIIPNDDIVERTSRWVDKCVKKFNPYARYNVKHWKNPHANIFYIKKQKEPRSQKK